MISGAHAILYSADPDADRDFLRDVLGLSHVDVGGGWLIFGLPPSEIAVHPAEKSGTQELYLLVDDVKAFIAAMGKRRSWRLPAETRASARRVASPRHSGVPRPGEDFSIALTT